MQSYPKISIVTATLNQASFIEETILSIIDQQYPNLEYIIIDGGSNDGTIDIIKKYEHRLAYWISEKDRGLYDALNKGFQKATGEIMSWLNSDDILHRKALSTIASVFMDFPIIEWLSGVPSQVDEMGRSIWVGVETPWNKYRYLNLDYKYIQQEGIFWRRSLWEKSGGYLSTQYTLASDLELWSRFFNYAHLYSLPGLVGCFRLRSGNQKSLEGGDKYHEEAISILKKMPITAEEARIRKIKSSLSYRLLKSLNFQRLFYLLGYQKVEQIVDKTPSKLYFDRTSQHFVLGDQ
ncbi:MAG TPA: glycosyltransferase family 2 protein [Puia sp.]|jgi:glycosyltransferase involved in cell wall biosynthesis|nr:glycosyltransferase family 2 protein [Puia sp.]